VLFEGADEAFEDPLRLVTVGRDGDRLLCAVATPQAEDLHSTASPVADLGKPDAEVQDLMPSIERADLEQISDESLEPDDEIGAVEGWARSWQEQPYGGISTVAIRFESASAATSYIEDRAHKARSDSITAFEVPGVDGALGLRQLGYAWLWIQPPDSGPYVDSVLMRMGDVVAVVEVANLSPQDGHTDAVDLAEQMVEASAP
jgi:hypothetical protein